MSLSNRILLIPLLIVVGLWALYIIFSPQSTVQLPFDDAWYYIKTAQNFAGGNGVTFDRLTTTDGFHPFWFGLLTLFQFVIPISDPDLLMRVVLLIQLAAVVGTFILIRRAFVNAKFQHQYYWFVVMILVAINPLFVKILINGQESALLVLMIAFGLLAYIEVQRNPCVSTYIWLGIASGAIFLARMDAIFFAFGVCVILLHDIIQQKPRARLYALTFSASSLLVVAPYLIIHYIVYDHFLTVSGTIKSTDNSLTRYAVFIVYELVVAITLLLMRKRYRVINFFYPLFVYVLSILVYYFLLYDASPRPWYAAPVILLGVIIIVPILKPANATWNSRLSMYAVCVSGLIIAVACWIYRIDPETYSLYESAIAVGNWMNENLPEDEPVGAWDAGFVGAYSQRGVTDLGGLIASWDYKTNYLDTRQEQKFLDDSHIEYVAAYLPTVPLMQLDPDWVVYRGVDLSNWHVLYSDPYRFRSLLQPWVAKDYVFFVLTRDPKMAEAAPTLVNWVNYSLAAEKS